ncbi:MAG TPA: ABC transporter, partial [Arthrobacter bacterium]|nr:ABC transporter [Arthrobacter sp.]
GLAKVQVLGVSAVKGTGVDKVRSAIRSVVVQRQAISQRLAADVSRASGQLREAAGVGEAAGVRPTSRSRLTDELAAAANV